MIERSLPAVLAVVALTGCGGAAAPPVSPPPPPQAVASPPITASPPPAPPAPALAARAEEAPSPPPPRLAEPLPPLTRRFVTFTLPGVKGALVSVHGGGPKDIWFLSDELPDPKVQFATSQGVAVQFDGARGVKPYKRVCWGAIYASVRGHRGGVLMQGGNPFARSYVGTAVTSTLLPGGQGDCGNLGPAPRLSTSSGDRVWVLLCKTQEGGLCSLTSPGGPEAPLPTVDASSAAGEDAALGIDVLWMRGLDDGWMTATDPSTGERSLLRYNGVTWIPRARLRAGLTPVDLWADAEGHAWITAERGAGAGARMTVLRFDGQALQELALPDTFAGKWVQGTGPKDVWFFEEGRKVYQWDGAVLHQGETPFKFGGAWAAPGGEVWLVGHHVDSDGPPKPGEAGVGVAAHTAPPAEAP